MIKPSTKSEFPFSIKEPAVYQGNFVVGDGVTEKKWSVARKNDKWRIDFFDNSELIRTELRTDLLYQVDHVKKVFAPTPIAGDPMTANLSVDELTSGLFRGKEDREFDDLGRDGNLHKYRVREPANSNNEILIFFDETLGMMVREEFTSKTAGSDASKYFYEIRELKTDVDDSIFQIPQGYRKVSVDDLRPRPANKP